MSLQFRGEKDFIDVVAELTCAIRESNDCRKSEFDWLRAHHGFATHDDIKEMEKRLACAIAAEDRISPETRAQLDGLTQRTTRLLRKLERLDARNSQLQPPKGA